MIRVVKSTDGGASFAPSGIKVADTKVCSISRCRRCRPATRLHIYTATDTGPQQRPLRQQHLRRMARHVRGGEQQRVRQPCARAGRLLRDGATWTVTTPHPTTDG